MGPGPTRNLKSLVGKNSSGPRLKKGGNEGLNERQRKEKHKGKNGKQYKGRNMPARRECRSGGGLRRKLTKGKETLREGNKNNKKKKAEFPIIKRRVGGPQPPAECTGPPRTKKGMEGWKGRQPEGVKTGYTGGLGVMPIREY